MKIKGYKQSFIIYSVLFVILFAAAYIGYFASGRTFITKIDGVDQYYMSFLYFGKYLRGMLQGAPMYDLSIGMGEDIIGSLNYYGFWDPVYLISVFADGSLAPYLFSFSFFVRLFIAGCAFMVYCREMKIEPLAATAGAFCFIVNGFTYGGVSSYMGWASVLIYLPLFLTGVERIFKGKKKGGILILLMSVYAGLCGFYFLYMSCVFLVVYCIGRGIAVFGIKNIKTILLKSLTAALFLVLGIAVSAPIFFPSVLGFMGSERADISIFDIIFNKKNWTPYWPVYLSFINKSARYYFKYICKITLAEYAAVIAAFFLPRSKGKLQLCIANVVIFLVVALPITGYIFSGFGESGFEVNTRWAFLIHFVFAMTLMYVLSADWKEQLVRYRAWIITAAFVAVMVNVGYFVFNNAASQGGRIDLENLKRNMDSPVVYSKVIAEDGGLYRVSADRFLTTADRPENTAMIKDYNGITYWLSIMNNYTQKTVNELTGLDEEWRSDGFSHDGVYETMMGVKYYLHKGNAPVPEGYVKVEDIDYYDEAWEVYENTSAFGLAYVRNAGEAKQQWDNRSDYGSYYSRMRDIAASDCRVENLVYDKYRDTISCSALGSEGDELILSVPFSEGWEAFVDGQRADIAVKDIMCMSIPLSGEGSHEILLKYHSRGFEAGKRLSAVIVCILLFVLFEGLLCNELLSDS